MLDLYIEKATNLGIRDINGFSDPYVKIYSKICGKTYKVGQTKIIMKNLNPVWDEVFHFPSIIAESLLFEIFDYDALKADDFIGNAELSIKDAKIGEEMVLPVKNVDKLDSTLTIKIVISQSECKIVDSMKSLSKVVCSLKTNGKNVTLHRPFFRVKLFDSELSEELPRDPVIRPFGVVATFGGLTYSYLIDLDKISTKRVKFYLENIDEKSEFGIVELSTLPKSSKTEKMWNTDKAIDLTANEATQSITIQTGSVIAFRRGSCSFTMDNNSLNISLLNEEYTSPFTEIQTALVDLQKDPEAKGVKDSISAMFEKLNVAINAYKNEENPVSMEVNIMIIKRVSLQFIDAVKKLDLNDLFERQIGNLNRTLASLQ